MRSFGHKINKYFSKITSHSFISKPHENSIISSFLSVFDSLPKGIFAISLFGLFLGASTTMVYSQLSLFMKNELHASEMKIAMIDGIVEFIAYAIRIFSGVVSDYFMNRKVILFAGCALTLCMKPLFAMAHSSVMVMVAQSIERMGNGLQASPRDALIADLSDDKTRGQSFGFSKSFKTMGSFLGTCAAIFIMWFTNNNYRIVFLCSGIAVAISILCLSKIKTKQEISGYVNTDRKMENPFKKKYLKSMDLQFWKMIALAIIFELGHFSEHLFPIYAQNFVSITMAGSVGIFISIGQVLCSFPIGLYADRLGKGRFIRICILMMIAANIIFMTATSITSLYVAAFLWGGQMTAVQGLFLSILSQKVNKHLRGTAIGIYYCAVGISYLVASTTAGKIWHLFGSKYSFIYSIIFCVISLFLFRTLLPKKYEHGN